jgi:hypothetical protein
MVDGIGGPRPPGTGAPGLQDPTPEPKPFDPKDPYNLRQFIQQGAGAETREQTWRERERANLSRLEQMTPTQRYAEFSQMAREGKRDQIERLRDLLDMTPEQREARLAQDYRQTQDQEVSAMTSIFKSQFQRLIMNNQRNVEDSIKGR